MVRMFRKVVFNVVLYHRTHVRGRIQDLQGVTVSLAGDGEHGPGFVGKREEQDVTNQFIGLVATSPEENKGIDPGIGSSLDEPATLMVSGSFSMALMFW